MLKESEVDTAVEVRVGEETQTVSAIVRKLSKDGVPRSATHKTNG